MQFTVLSGFLQYEHKVGLNCLVLESWLVAVSIRELHFYTFTDLNILILKNQEVHYLLLWKPQQQYFWPSVTKRTEILDLF